MKNSEQRIINLINEKVTTFNPDYDSIKGVVQVEERNKLPRTKLIWLSSIMSLAAILIIVLVVVISQNVPSDVETDNLTASGVLEDSPSTDNSQLDSSSPFGIISSEVYNQIMANMFASSANTYSYSDIISTELLTEDDEKVLNTSESYSIAFSIYNEQDIVGLVDSTQTSYLYFVSNIPFSNYISTSSVSVNNLIISIENGILTVE